jgi:UDP-N-acetylmuramoyl-tripeptide--D-alanyl-D-alanine ligase
MSATPIPDNRAVFSAEEVVRATGARVLAEPTQASSGVCIDSRRVTEGALFVALRGERHDAHDHLAEVLAKGASALLVERAVNAPAGVGVFVVDDTLRALGALAALHRRRFEIPVVAITGSVGKTTTKELVAAALAGLGLRTLATPGNLNNRVGVPMTLFLLEAEHEAAVLELGMNVPGEIADLTEMVAPSVGVVTAVAHVHTEGVGGLEGVAREKGALLGALGRHAVAVWNADASLLGEYAARTGASRTIAYGRGESADVRLVRWVLDGHETRASYRVVGRADQVEARLSLLGEAAAFNAAGALAVLEALTDARGPLGDSAKARERYAGGVEALGTVSAAPHRMTPIALPSGLLVIDDAYNASPSAVVAALETAAALAASRGGGVVAVLGDMFELGREAESLHAQVGREAVRIGAKALVACGGLMTHAGKAAINESGALGRRIRTVLLRDPAAAAACAAELASPSDVVLVKGSRGMRMERVVEALVGGASPEESAR